LTLSDIGGAGPKDLPVWLPVAFVAIVISFLIVSLAYMAGSFFGDQDLVFWAKNELFQTAAVALMLAILFVFFSFLDTMFLPGATANTSGGALDLGGGAPGGNIMVKVMTYNQNLFLLLQSEFTGLLFLQVVASGLVESALRIMPGGSGFTLNIGSFFAPISHFVGYGLNFIGIALWAVQLQAFIVIFANQYMFRIFLPLGIVFRSFPFTRGVGGALIAIAIGFYVVYPLTFVINMELAEKHYPGISQPLFDPMTLPFVQIFNANVFDLSKGDFFGSGVVLNSINIVAYIVKFVLSSITNAVVLSFRLLGTLFVGSGMLEEIFYTIIAYTMVLPLINVFITLTFIRELASLFGADVNLQSVTRLI
jgi:hypothetical protein